jgi:hypothetical protein
MAKVTSEHFPRNSTFSPLSSGNGIERDKSSVKQLHEYILYKCVYTINLKLEKCLLRKSIPLPNTRWKKTILRSTCGLNKTVLIREVED